MVSEDSLNEPTILIVDDHKLNIEMLVTVLSQDYNIRVARNGEECLKRSVIEPYPDLILLDIMMPVLDGFETIKLLKKDKKTKDIPVIFLTALTAKEDIVQGFKLGAVDYLTKPFNITELIARIQTHLELKFSREKIENQKQELEYLNEALSDTLMLQKKYIAKSKILQKSMIQKTVPLFTEFAIQALYLPCENMGGDFFSIIRGVHHKKLVIILGDCTGHGLQASIEASLLTSIVQKGLSDLFETSDTAAFLTGVNSEFIKVAEEDKFPTIFICLIDMESKEIVYSNANGVLPSLLRNGKIFRPEPVAGMHIGYSDQTVFESRKVKIQDGDRIYFYSDAVLEHKAANLEHIGRARFEEILNHDSGYPSRDFGEIISALEKTAGTLPLDDDTTLIQLDVGPIFRKEFYFSTLEEYEEIEEEIKTVLEQKDYLHDETIEIAIGLDEMCLNAFYHGNREDTAKQVIVEAVISSSDVYFKITDMGDGFDPKAVPDPVAGIEEIYGRNNPDEYMHGRGMVIVRNFFDKVKYNQKGCSVEIRRKKRTRNVIFLADEEIFSEES